MRAHARVVVGAGRDGRATFPELRSAPPLTLRPTSDGRLVVAGSAAGPIGGDDLALDLRLQPDAVVEVGSVAATLALPAPSTNGQDAPWSRTAVTVDVPAGAALWWAPQPTVVCAGARHRSVVQLDVAAGARVRWRELLVLGRHDEPPGTVHAGLTVDLDGRPLLRHELRLGPGERGWDGPAGVCDARVVGSELLVGPGAAEVARVAPAVGAVSATPLAPGVASDAAGAAAVVLPLADVPASFATAIGGEVTVVATLLDALR